MKNFKALQSQIDIDSLLEYYKFEIHEDDGKYMRSACKIHDGDNPTAFVINKETSLWYCHTGCGGGDVFTLVQKMEDCTFVEAVNFLVEKFNLDVEQIEISALELEVRKELQEWMAHNKMLRHKAPFEECPVKPETVEIASYRSFDKSTLDAFGVKFINEISLINKKGKYYTIYDRIFFPIMFENKYIGFSLRRSKKDDIMKWSNQPRDIDIGRVLYNYDNVSDLEEIVVVEGIIDVLACYEANIPSVCTFGAHLSKEQELLLLKTGADITFAYDGDKAGREATRKAAKQLRNKATIRMIEIPDNEDCESIKRSTLIELYSNRIKI